VSAPAIYRVEHRTHYLYETRVSTSQHIACLEPRELPVQHVRQFTLAADPQPARMIRRIDYFGNILHQFQLLGPHDELSVITESLVEVGPRVTRLQPDATIAWEHARDRVARPPSAVACEVVQYAGRSAKVAVTPDIAAFARDSFPPGRPVLEGAIHLMRRIHGEFTFDPTATTPATPVSKVLTERRGVCQDFAHFQIACLRALGLAARYVSGYLLTDPPPGQPRLIGADASHAWLAIYIPDTGWVDLDPTNDLIPDQRHITIGWGRDYGDVTPLRGVLLGGASHQLLVGVSVVPMEDAP
jgi:transglutaminase-like putative cysteine protease